MSLVSEALRKARQEAAEKGAQQRGVVFRTTVVLGPKGTRFSVGWLAVSIVAAAALAGAGIAWLALSPRAGLAPAPPSTAHPAAAAGASTSTSPVAPAEAASTAVPASSPAPPRSALAQGALATVHRPTETQPDNAATQIRQTGGDANATDQTGASAPLLTAHAPPVVGAPASAPPALRGGPSPAGAARERSFVLDADLGKVKLHLDYIVYRSKDPFAGINGQEVMIGTIIEGLTVEEIGPEVVRLRDDRGTVVLRAH